MYSSKRRLIFLSFLIISLTFGFVFQSSPINGVIIVKSTLFILKCSGYIQNNCGVYLEDAQVSLYGRLPGQSYYFISSTTTDASGHYSITVIFSGLDPIVLEPNFKLTVSKENHLSSNYYFYSLGTIIRNFQLTFLGYLPESQPCQFSSRDPTALTYSIRTLNPVLGLDPLVSFIIDRISGFSNAIVEVYLDNQLAFTDYLIGITDSYSFFLPQLESLGTHSISIVLDPYVSVGNIWELQFLKITQLGWDQNINKIAFFISPEIWADQTLSNFIPTVQEHCFQTTHFESPSNWQNIFTSLDSLEDQNSIVFIYIGGHGNYNPTLDGGTGDSFIVVNPDTDLRIYSSELQPYLLNLESNRIEVMVSSCYAGGFYDDLNFDGITIMTSSDTEHTSNSNFEFYFQIALDMGMDDMDAFEYAASYFDGFWNQIANPLANWRSWHSFFGP
ncbi:MAG: hypothetical protein ACFFDW_06580 [Candidatus Thorarchaeota archaeon]